MSRRRTISTHLSRLFRVSHHNPHALTFQSGSIQTIANAIIQPRIDALVRKRLRSSKKLCLRSEVNGLAGRFDAAFSSHDHPSAQELSDAPCGAEGAARVRDARCGDPDTVKKLIGLGLTVAIETGAGSTRPFRMPTSPPPARRSPRMPAAALAGAGIVFAVQMPEPEQRALIPRGALLVCTANAFAEPDLVPCAGGGRHRHARRWSCCRASPAPSRWTCCRARRTSPATAR